jgi:hypothetical protein
MNKNTVKQLGVMLLAFCVATGIALASQVTFPSTFPFVANTPIRAAEVNSTFIAVKTAVDDNHARLSTAEASLTALTARVAALEAATGPASRLYGEQGSLDANAAVDDAWVDVQGINIPLTLTAARNVRYLMVGRIYNFGAAPTALTDCSVRIVRDITNTPLIPPTLPTTTGDWTGTLSGDSTSPDNMDQVTLSGVTSLPAGNYNFKVQVVRKARATNSGNCSIFRWPYSKARLLIDLVP